MKKILITSTFVILSGCSLWMAGYDSSEYMLVNKIRTTAELGNCEPTTINSLYVTTTEFKNFAQYIPRNQATIDLSKNLYTLVDELHKKENPSPAYCKIKLNIIAKSAEQIQQVVGSKPR
jgi:hypothetical protein